RPRAWPARSRLRVRELAQPARDAAQQADGHARLLREQLLEVPRCDREAGRLAVRRDRRDARHLVEQREFAEELARPQARDLLPVTGHAGGAADDEEEPGPDLALADD